MYAIYDFLTNPDKSLIYLYAHLVACVLVFEFVATLFKKFKNEKGVILNFFTLWAKNKKVKGFFAIVICAVILFMIIFSNPQTHIAFGSTDIRLMPEGTYCRYVYATNEKGKTYTLPAKIEKYNTYIEHGGYVEEVYFDNGGYLYFGDTCELLMDKNHTPFGDGFDQQDREWEIEITQKVAKHDRVVETNPRHLEELIFPIVETIAIICSLINFLIALKKGENYV